MLIQIVFNWLYLSMTFCQSVCVWQVSLPVKAVTTQYLTQSAGTWVPLTMHKLELSGHCIYLANHVDITCDSILSGGVWDGSLWGLWKGRSLSEGELSMTPMSLSKNHSGKHRPCPFLVIPFPMLLSHVFSWSPRVARYTSVATHGLGTDEKNKMRRGETTG